MLPEMQIVKHDLTAGCSPLSRDIGLCLTSETLALCRIGKQYAVRGDLPPKARTHRRALCGHVAAIRLHKRSFSPHKILEQTCL